MRAIVIGLIVVVLGVGGLYAAGFFEEEKGPAESLGEALDKTLEDAKRNFEQATQ